MINYFYFVSTGRYVRLLDSGNELDRKRLLSGARKSVEVVRRKTLLMFKQSGIQSRKTYFFLRANGISSIISLFFPVLFILKQLLQYLFLRPTLNMETLSTDGCHYTRVLISCESPRMSKTRKTGNL
jgi:hypothetical protein